ncbi:hypothetical protein MKL09_04405 [Methylobacterium sp. J-048]|uniref:hypothetical protein n=1 Tax=Methylobacterium sp. J-048 TaxID=2836635 RepID=UPI001FBB0030|nr:hypothetical protein [Methylobacterium sp. J-048]MCJ2055788.1 hypothetical protein [Methylobacterium sp. J-048]
MSRAAPDPAGKRHPISFRTTHELRDRLESEAKANGRSISQEIEFRIENSYELSQSKKAFEQSNAIASALIGDDKTASMIRAISASIGSAMMYSGKHWDRDIYTRAAVKACIDAVRVASFRDEQLEIEDADQIDADLIRKFDKIGRMFGGLMALSRNDPKQMAAVEAFAEIGDGSADPDTAEVIASLIERVR